PSCQRASERSSNVATRRPPGVAASVTMRAPPFAMVGTSVARRATKPPSGSRRTSDSVTAACRICALGSSLRIARGSPATPRTTSRRVGTAGVHAATTGVSAARSERRMACAGWAAVAGGLRLARCAGVEGAVFARELLDVELSADRIADGGRGGAADRAQLEAKPAQIRDLFIRRLRAHVVLYDRRRRRGRDHVGLHREVERAAEDECREAEGHRGFREAADEPDAPPRRDGPRLDSR